MIGRCIYCMNSSQGFLFEVGHSVSIKIDYFIDYIVQIENRYKRADVQPGYTLENDSCHLFTILLPGPAVIMSCPCSHFLVTSSMNSPIVIVEESFSFLLSSGSSLSRWQALQVNDRHKPHVYDGSFIA